MWKHAWAMGGFNVYNQPYKGLNELLFQFDEYDCSTSECIQQPFLNCSHCRRTLCLKCFFEDYHYHPMDF